MAFPEPTEVAPWYLRNINQALALDEASGNVYVRTGFTGNIVIEGNVSVPGNIDAHILEIGTSGNLTVPWMPVSIDGNSAVTITSGNITVAQGTNPWIVSGNVNANVTGSTVSLTGNLAGITGNVTVIDGGGSLTVDGTVAVTQSGSWTVNIQDGGNTITVDGTVGITGNVNIGTMPNINANITGGNVTVQQGTSPWVVSGNVGISGNANVILADDANVIISGFSGATSDAFGRLRVSNPYSLFETQARYFDHQQFASNVTGIANVVYVGNQSSYQLNVGTGVNDSVLRETLKPFPYQPGKSQLTLNTFCMSTPKTNLRQRVGLFDANDGVYFENDGTYNYFVIRSGSTGVEERVRQDAWNGDRLNGLGGANNPSGYTLYPNRTQIMFADVEWLGVGSVRVGFIINGNYIICNTFNHANQVGNTMVYMTTATLPIRYEITNTGVTAGNSTMTQICSSVISEGGFQLAGSGNPRAASHLIGTPVRLPNDQSFKPVISIRLKSTNLNAVVIPINYSLVPVAQSLFQFRIYKKAITSGGSWVSSAADSSVEYNLAPTALVSGDIVEQTFINSTNQTSAAPTQESFTFSYQLERQPFTGLAYEYCIMMATTGTNQDVYASIEWQEIT